MEIKFKLMETSLTPILKDAAVSMDAAQQLQISLIPFFEKVQEWKTTIDTIVITRPDETGKMKMAREGRLTLRQMRLDGTDIVKKNREVIKKRMESDVLEDKLWLKAGQIMEAEYKELEAKLEEKEKFAEIWEANRRKELHKTRATEMSQYGWDDLGFVDLGGMDDGSYAALLEGTRQQYQKRLEEEKRQAELQAEAKRQEILAQDRKNICYREKLTNFIPDYTTLNFGQMTVKRFGDLLADAKKARVEYEDNQRKIAEAKAAVQPPVETPVVIEELAVSGENVEVTRLRAYARSIRELPYPSVQSPSSKEIISKVQVSLNKVADWIESKL